MNTYARICSGYLIDVYQAPYASILEAQMGVTGFVWVPDGTKNGSAVTVDQNGHILSITPPAPPPPLDPTIAVRQQLEDLDIITGPRWFEAWQNDKGDKYIKAAVAQKVALRAQLVPAPKK